MYWKRNLVLAWLMAMSSTVAALAASSPDRLKDNVLVGQGTATTKKITFDIGSGSANPAIQSTSTGVLQFAMDGVNFSTFGSGGGGGTGVNVLKNPGFEIGTANWTNAGSATFTTTASGANVGFDLAAGAWTPSATGATLTSDQYTVPSGMYGSVCSASVWYLGGSANVTLKVINGSSTVLASQVLSAQTAYVQTADLRFACPSSGTFALQLASTGSSATVYLDNAFLGQAPRRAPEDRNENLVVNGNAEDGLNPTNWTTYNDGASAALLTGTGGTASGLAAAAISSTSPIGGSRSWLMSKTGGSSAQGQGWSYQFTVNAKSQYQNALNDLAFDYYFDAGGAANADTVRVYLYDVTNSTVITPQFVTCGGGTTPSLAAVTTTCHAELGWLASATATTYRLGFHVAGTTTSTFNLTVDNLFVGQHRLTVGTQVSAWQSYTPTVGGVTTLGNGTLTGQYRRVGDSLEVAATIVKGSTSTIAASALTFSLPTGFTINTTALDTSITAQGALGTAHSYGASSQDYLGVVRYNSTTIVGLIGQNSTTGTTGTWSGTTVLVNTGDAVSVHFTVPANEIAGGSAFGENKCEYSYNSGNVTSAGGSDTTSFGYGPQGTPILSYASNNAGTSTSFIAQFLTPISATDEVKLEVLNSGSAATWTSAIDGSIGFLQETTCNYGAVLVPQSAANQVQVRFGNCGYGQTGAAASGGGLWSSINTWKWRVKKCKAGMPTSFGLANSTTPGLQSAYEEYSTTVTSTGGCAIANAFKVVRAGSKVTLDFANNSLSSDSIGCTTSAAQCLTWAGVVPSRFLKPGVSSGNSYFFVNGNAGAGQGPNQLFVNQNNGNVSWCASNGSTFGNATAIILFRGAVDWTIN